ncbi:hypothetical protein HFZ78_17515 [Priestia megaterium]|uniref:Uncharacterized protein n=1 Tax=Priestia megaterium TaxID=1404 RepID=A0A6H1P408_PRIMG|nr:hypothetical protein [Priestia megaterium]QIZ08299.1 hypothetical protein HFZ78_17515 [Priestia megaterium]
MILLSSLNIKAINITININLLFEQTKRKKAIIISDKAVISKDEGEIAIKEKQYEQLMELFKTQKSSSCCSS